MAERNDRRKSEEKNDLLKNPHQKLRFSIQAPGVNIKASMPFIANRLSQASKKYIKATRSRFCLPRVSNL